MTTIDNLVLKIVNYSSPTIEENLPHRDSRVLRSLATAINSHFFITENQSRLLIKILKENREILSKIDNNFNEVLTRAVWSREFRQIEQVRKLYVLPAGDGNFTIAIEFTFSSAIRKILSNLAKTVDGLIQIHPGKLFHADFTEKNIIELIDSLTPHNFQIEESLKNHYDTIKLWSKSDFQNQFLITAIVNQNFEKHITADLGVETAIDQNIIVDRSNRYQYFVENCEKTEENLTSFLAYRKKTKVWIDKNKFSLSEIFQALVNLKRLPVLVVFDNHSITTSQKNLKILEILIDSLEKNNLDKKVGIYFRLPNDEVGKKFNQLIAEKTYNNHLDIDTEIVGIQSGKIPKFFLTSNWKPMSIITIDSSLRNSKTAVYANCCDLIISYSDSEPIIETRTVWA
jgi:peroxiredoxin